MPALLAFASGTGALQLAGMNKADREKHVIQVGGVGEVESEGNSDSIVRPFH